MTGSDSRIEQFRKMAEADPDNELGHFSLGRALLDAGANEQAAASLRRALELNPNLSKAYEMLAAAMLGLGRRDEAIAQLTSGVKVASAQGEEAPKNQMVKMLRELGAAVPESTVRESAPTATQSVGEGQVLCSRCGQIGKRLASPPFSNAQGKEIFQKVCADCWKQWIAMGTKVINELRLPLSDPQAQKIFDSHMKEFLNL